MCVSNKPAQPPAAVNNSRVWTDCLSAFSTIHRRQQCSLHSFLEPSSAPYVHLRPRIDPSLLPPLLPDKDLSSADAQSPRSRPHYSHTRHHRNHTSTTTAMAPPPPASLPLSQRLAALAQTLQFAWFAGHVTLLLSAFRYSLSYITFNYGSRWAAFSYRTAFLSACVTYGIVVYKAYRARVRQGKQGGLLSLAVDENVQYLSKSTLSSSSHRSDRESHRFRTGFPGPVCGLPNRTVLQQHRGVSG